MTPDLSAAFLRCKDFLTLPGWVDVENASPECVADLLLIAREWAKTSGWTRDSPTNPGTYWFYGVVLGEYGDRKCLHIADVWYGEGGKFIDIRGMNYRTPTESFTGFWLRIPTPELPKESRP